MTSLAAVRESLRRNNVSNWNTLSDAAVARIFGLRQPSSEGVSRADNTYRPTLNRLEKKPSST